MSDAWAKYAMPLVEAQRSEVTSIEYARLKRRIVGDRRITDLSKAETRAALERLLRDLCDQARAEEEQGKSP